MDVGAAGLSWALSRCRRLQSGTLSPKLYAHPEMLVFQVARLRELERMLTEAHRDEEPQMQLYQGDLSIKGGLVVGEI